MVNSETDPELAAVLDAEYREFVRSLHRETMDIIIQFQEWWDGVRVEDDGTVIRGAFSVAVFLMSRESAEDLNEEDQRAAKIAEARWRDTIHPRLSSSTAIPIPTYAKPPMFSTNEASNQ